MNVSCLAKVTDGFTQGHIVKVVKGVLTDRRIRQQFQKPLSSVEFIPMIAGLDPVYKEEEESFKVNAAPTARARARQTQVTCPPPSSLLSSMNLNSATYNDI